MAGHIYSEDAEIFYDTRGEGPPLVLLHPFPSNRDFWNPVAAQMATRYRLIVPDLRCHGDSQPGTGPATMQKHAADLVRILEAERVQRTCFAGVSIGGYILFEFWRRYRERVQALILCDTRAQADTDEGRQTRLKAAEEVERSGPDDYLDSMLPKLLGETTRRNRQDRVSEARRMMGRMTRAGISAALRGMAARPDSVPTLRTINVPVLVLAGTEDTLTPPADAELMHRAISGSQFALVPAAGHYMPFEQPESAGQLMRGFLEKQI
ncbi:MAG: alpha/beta hydrolase [Acidobacteria bacterium]|nr:MAG: alpha/beta hydrolase [Acidobacteriota bacterium]